MAGDEDRRVERAKPGRRDPARAVRHDAPIIEGSASEVTPIEAASPSAMQSDAAATGPSEATPDRVMAEPAAGAPPSFTDAAEPAAAAEPTLAGGAAASPQDAARADALVSGEPENAADRAERGRSNFATAMAVAVVLMAGAIIYLFYQLSSVGPDVSGEIAGLNSRLAAVESRPAPDVGSVAKQAASAQQTAAQAQSAVAALAKRVEGLAAPQPAQPNLQPQVADLQGSIADLRKSLAALQGTVAALPRPDTSRLEARVGDLDGRISNLDSRISSLQGVVSGIPHVDLGPLTGKVDALEGRMKPLEAEVAAAQSPQQVAERKAAPVAVTAQAVVEAIAAGQAFPQEFRALQVLGVDAAKLAPLQTVAANGAPSLHDLQDDLAAVRDRIVAQGTPAPAGSYMDRLMAGAGNLVQVRPLGTVVGDTPGAIVARMNDEIGADDLSAALADWQKLPEASRTASKSLPERIKLRLDAELAARDIAANAIGAIATPRG